jgi:hypothetical protein
MEGRALPVSLCLDNGSCFHEHATDFSMPVECSAMEGRELLASLCLNHCSRFYENSTHFSMPLLCSDMEGRGLLAISDIWIRSDRH